jgi:ATP-binding cassette, subfamily B, bacterial
MPGAPGARSRHQEPTVLKGAAPNSPRAADLINVVLGGLRPHWVLALVTGLAVLPRLAFVALQPLLYQAIVDSAILAGNAARLVELVTALVVLLGVCLASDTVKAALSARLASNILNDWRARIFDHLQRLSLDFYARAQLGDLLSRYTSDLEALETALVTTFPTLLVGGLASIICIVLMFTTAWRIAWPCLFIILAITFIPRLLGPRADRAGYQRQQDVAQLASTVQEVVGAQPVVKAFGLQEHTRDQLFQHLAAIERSSIRFGLLSGLLRSMVVASGNSMNAVALAIGAYLVIGEQLSLGTLLAFIDLAWYLAAYLAELADQGRPFQQAVAANTRIQELLTEVPRVLDADDAVAVPPFAEALRFEQVTFSYAGERPNLEQVAFTIQKGESVAIIGPSGSGKSTVLNLLLRFYDPSDGRVLVDGLDLRQANQASWRAQIGTVFQESFLFNISIRENIRLGRAGASDREVEAAARAAEVYQFVEQLPRGLDTLVGERGGQLSGGQRQRVAIARAILRDPALLVLDEPTSALDAATERAINATLMRLAAGRTVIAVTHRLAMVADLDRILVLERGQLVESGSHAELLAQDGAYAALWRKQSGFTLDTEAGRVHVDAESLRQIPLFADLLPSVLADIAARFALETVAAGRTVIFEGDAGDKFYVIVHGRAAVSHRAAAGEAQRLAVLEDGDYFGEIALLQSAPRNATVTTLVQTVLLTLSRNQFLDVIHDHPELLAALEREVARRLAPVGDH